MEVLFCHGVETFETPLNGALLVRLTPGPGEWGNELPTAAARSARARLAAFSFHPRARCGSCCDKGPDRWSPTWNRYDYTVDASRGSQAIAIPIMAPMAGIEPANTLRPVGSTQFTT